MIRKLCHADNLPAEGTLKAFADSRPESHWRFASVCSMENLMQSTTYVLIKVLPYRQAHWMAKTLCPLHAWKWNLKTGEPLHSGDPALPCYELRQYGDEIFVRIPTKCVGKEAS